MTYTITDFHNNTYTVDINAETMTITNKNGAFHEWAIRTGKDYVYKFFKNTVWTESERTLQKHFEALQHDKLFMCRFEAITRKFGLDR